MIPIMAITQADIDALEAALVSGELRVRKGDREVTYRSIDEIEKALSRARRAMAGQGNVTGRHQLAEFGE